jgi:hypothetical protein
MQHVELFLDVANFVEHVVVHHHRVRYFNRSGSQRIVLQQRISSKRLVYLP